MKKVILAVLLSTAIFNAKAQTKNLTEHDPAIRAKDSTIKVDIIDPAKSGGEAPDWAALTTTITEKYDAVFADRTITKAKIYFYYGKDWPQFTTGIVHYTELYEDPNDLKLLNKNAKMILQYSTDKKELQSALNWSRSTVDKEPANADYQATYTALQAKVK